MAFHRSLMSRAQATLEPPPTASIQSRLDRKHEFAIRISQLEISLIQGRTTLAARLVELEPALAPILISFLAFRGSDGVSDCAESALRHLSGTRNLLLSSFLSSGIEAFLDSPAMQEGLIKGNGRYARLQRDLEVLLRTLDQEESGAAKKGIKPIAEQV